MPLIDNRGRSVPFFVNSFSYEHIATANCPLPTASLIPGRDTRCKVSEIAFQSLSDKSTAFPLFPFMTTGLCELTVSSISL